MCCRHPTARLVADMNFARHYVLSPEAAGALQLLFPCVLNSFFSEKFSVTDALIGSDVPWAAGNGVFIRVHFLSLGSTTCSAFLPQLILMSSLSSLFLLNSYGLGCCRFNLSNPELIHAVRQTCGCPWGE